MRRQTKADTLVLIDHWRSLVPKRPLTYGEHLHYGREQALHFRALAGHDKPAIDVSWLYWQTAIPVSKVPSYVLGEERSGHTTNLVEGKLQIFINENEPPLRQRFTVLHEWKHALDFPSNGILYQVLGTGDKDVQSNQIEGIANDFAAHVLMPTEMVQHVWRDTQDIRRTAAVFKVSGEAMRLRLEKLGLIRKPELGTHPNESGRSRSLALFTTRSDPYISPCAV